MTNTKIAMILSLMLLSIISFAQTPAFFNVAFPKETVFHQNISYANDTLKKHLLDIYLPPNATSNTPVVIWVHGGAWMHNDKYADMSYMTSTIKAIMDKGYALASIDYRQSTTKIFPAQIQDCNQAIQFLYDQAGKYKLDKNRFALMGFSAGGHLASLLALSNNSSVPEFYSNNKKPTFKIKVVVDFYGPSNFLLFFGTNEPTDVDNPIATLLGASPLMRPDISNLASPVTYVDKNDPPFFIVHGEKDQDVPKTQSHLLKSYLDIAHVDNTLTIVKDAPHYGKMFDVEEVRNNLLAFLDKYMK
jgi:acetyl esterase/lipase